LGCNKTIGIGIFALIQNSESKNFINQQVIPNICTPLYIF